MRCTNCGLPLSPARALTNCPRCGAPLNAMQGAPQQQQSWEGNMGGAGQQSPWGQGSSSMPGSFSPFPPQNPGSLSPNRVSGSGGDLPPSPLAPRRPPYTTPPRKNNSRLLFVVAGLCVFLAAMLLGLIYVLGSANSNNNTPNTANSSSNTPTSGTTATAAATATTDASSTPEAGASPAGTAYPGQQYIDNAQLAGNVNKKTLEPENPATSFKVGAAIYVIFKLHPPSSGGVVCSYWYLSGKQITQYVFAVKGSQHASYTYAIYGSAGSAYVELYWASSKSCSDKVLAQHVDFTVTA